MPAADHAIGGIWCALSCAATFVALGLLLIGVVLYRLSKLFEMPRECERMGVRDFKSLGNTGVPIIGEPKILEWRPIVLFQCSCQESRPQLISATDQVVTCDGCKTHFIIHQVMYDASRGDGAGIALKTVVPRQPAGQA